MKTNIFRKLKGFTLLELVIVIAIIGILSVLVLPNLTGALAKARDSKRMAELRGIQTFLTTHGFETGSMFPTSTANLLTWYTATKTKAPNQLLAGNGGEYKYVGIGSAAACTLMSGPASIGSLTIPQFLVQCPRYQLWVNLEENNTALSTDADVDAAFLGTDAAFASTTITTLTASGQQNFQPALELHGAGKEACVSGLSTADCIFDLTL